MPGSQTGRSVITRGNCQQITILEIIIDTSHKRGQPPTPVITRYGFDRLGRTDIVPLLVLIRQVFHLDFRLLVCFLLDRLQESHTQRMVFLECFVIHQQVFPCVHPTVIACINRTGRTAGTVAAQCTIKLIAIPRAYIDTDIRTIFDIERKRNIHIITT